MGNRRVRLASLTPKEAARVREIATVHGSKAAAAKLGLCDVRTLTKVAFGEPVQTLTAALVRARLADEL